MKEYQPRLGYMDIFRGIGIILMVMGHVGFGNTFDYFIHAFHMPMFFFISGFFFVSMPEEELKTMDFIIKKCKTLLIPYCFWGIFHYISINTARYIVRGGVETESLCHLCFINTEGLPIAGALWFLTALFFANIIYFLLDRYIGNNMIKTILVIFLSLFGHVAAKFFTYRLPYALDASLVSLGLFHIAYIFKQHMNDSNIIKLFSLNKLFWTISGIIVTVLIFINGYIGVRSGKYAIVPLFWINAIGAIILGINFSKYLFDMEKKGKFFRFLIHELIYIGKNSMIYVVLNQFFIYAIQKITFYLGIDVLPASIMLILVMVILHICNIIFSIPKLKFAIGK